MSPGVPVCVGFCEWREGERGVVSLLLTVLYRLYFGLDRILGAVFSVDGILTGFVLPVINLQTMKLYRLDLLKLLRSKRVRL